MKNYNLLPENKTFEQLLLPFFAPYIIYILITTFWPENLSQDYQVIAKFIALVVTLGFFWKNYRFGSFQFKDVVLSLVVTPILLLIWIAPLYLWIDTSISHEYSLIYFIFRLLNTVILVAIFEELLMRVFLMQWFYQSGLKNIISILDEKPKALSILPLTTFSIILTTLLFTLGHAPTEYLSAVLYFLLTTLLYFWTKSFWVCIFTHGFTNLGIAILVHGWKMHFLWF